MYVRMYICMCTYVCMCLSSIVIQPTDDAASLASQFASVDMTEAPPPGPTHDPVAQLMHCRKTVELEEEEALAQLMSELPPEDPLPPLYGIKPPGPEAVIYIQPGPLVSCVRACVRMCDVCICICLCCTVCVANKELNFKLVCMYVPALFGSQ